MQAGNVKQTERRWRLALVVGIIAAVIALLISAGRDHSSHQAIRLERLKRVSLWTTGFALSGTPDFAKLDQRLASHGLQLGAPVFIRIFKREFELELWMKRDGRFHLFQTYPICKWSGRLGPKLRQGDHQAPEGFYTVSARAMNPHSRWHRSFNLGFPNAFDRAHNRTGSYLMVHGGCSSVGCYAMTNAAVDEIWRITTAAHKAGQRRFHVHAFPFRMTERNLSRFQDPRWDDFWRDLKSGHDAFEKTWLPPRIFTCKRRYVVAAVDDDNARGAYRITSACPPEHVRFGAKAATSR